MDDTNSWYLVQLITWLETQNNPLPQKVSEKILQVALHDDLNLKGSNTAWD